MVKDLVKKYTAVILAVLVLLGVWISGTVRLSDARQAERAAQADLTAAQSKVGVQRSAMKNNAEKAGEEVTGLRTDRRDQDDEKVQELMRTATTWTSSEEYEMARAQLAQQHKVPQDSEVLTTFMPPLKKAVDGDSTINEIDEKKLNSHYSSMDTFLIRSSAGENDYFGIVEISVDSADGSNDQSRLIPMTYTFDPNGEITDLKIESTWDDPVRSN